MNSYVYTGHQPTVSPHQLWGCCFYSSPLHVPFVLVWSVVSFLLLFWKLKECSFHGLVYLWKLFKRAKSKTLKYLWFGKCREVEERERMNRKHHTRLKSRNSQNSTRKTGAHLLNLRFKNKEWKPAHWSHLEVTGDFLNDDYLSFLFRWLWKKDLTQSFVTMGLAVALAHPQEHVEDTFKQFSVSFASEEEFPNGKTDLLLTMTDIATSHCFNWN